MAYFFLFLLFHATQDASVATLDVAFDTKPGNGDACLSVAPPDEIVAEAVRHGVYKISVAREKMSKGELFYWVFEVKHQ